MIKKKEKKVMTHGLIQTQTLMENKQKVDILVSASLTALDILVDMLYKYVRYFSRYVIRARLVHGIHS
jgi:hypothetical protein